MSEALVPHADGSGDDVFVHVSALEGTGSEELVEGQHVEFEVEQGPKGTPGEVGASCLGVQNAPGRDVRLMKGDKRRVPSSRREPRRNTDEEALALREENRSYAWVARSLGFKRANDARQGFLRALAKREGADRDALRGRELNRLDELEARIRRRDESEPDKMAGRLVALDRLRQELPER